MDGKQNVPKVKVLVCAHKITKTLKTDVFCPILLGTNYADDKTKKYFEQYYYDNTGDNISDKQPNFSELSGMYWAWKNMDKIDDPDYIGIFHYRRFLNFGDKIPGFNQWEYAFFDFDEETLAQFRWRDDYIKKMCKGVDLIVAETEKIFDPDDWLSSATLETHYKKPHYADDFHLAVETITRLYPDYEDVVDDFRNLEFGHYCNIFIMKKELFEEYAEWLFSILFDVEKHIDLSDEKYTGKNASQARIFGYLGERLLNCFILYKKRHTDIKVMEYQRLVGYLTQEEQKVYNKKYAKPLLDPHNLTRKERLKSATTLIYDGLKFIGKRIFR